MKYELTEANVKDLIEWLRGGYVNRAVIALEHLNPVADLAANVEPVAKVVLTEKLRLPLLQWLDLEKQFEMADGQLLYASPQQAVPAELIDALQELMAWQVKNVKCWHNSAYDNAVRAIARFNAAP